MPTLNKDLVGKHAFTAIVEASGYILGRADYGVGGYTPQRHLRFSTYEQAQAAAEKLNVELGLTKLQAAEIVLNTMR